MPEQIPPGLPGRLPLPPVSATPHGFAAVVAIARRRRRRRALEVVSGSTAVLVVAAALAVLPDGSTRDALTVATSPPAASAEATATSAASPTEPSPAPGGATPQAAPTPRQTPDAESSPEPAPGHAAPQPAPSDGPDKTSDAASGGEVGPPSERTAMRQGETCDGSGPPPVQGWCSYYDGALSGQSGQTVTLATAICRLAGQGPGRLTADDGRHADFAVGRQAGRPDWSWSHGRQFSSEGTAFTVESGTCVRWFVSWDLTDDQGEALPPGDYYLEALPQVTAHMTENGTSTYLDSTETFRITG